MALPIPSDRRVFGRGERKCTEHWVRHDDYALTQGKCSRMPLPPLVVPHGRLDRSVVGLMLKTICT